MPARKRYGRSKKKRSGKSIAKQLVRLSAKQLKPLANKLDGLIGEVKYHNHTYGDPAVMTRDYLIGFAGGITCTDMAQNLTDTGRVGDKVRLTSLTINTRFYIKTDGLAACDREAFVRFVIIQWKPVSVPTGADIFMESKWDSVFIHDKRSQFKVLMDKRILLSAGVWAGVNNPDTRSSIHIHKRIKNSSMISYVGGTTTASNNIYFFQMYGVQCRADVINAAQYLDSVYYEPRILVEYTDS